MWVCGKRKQAVYAAFGRRFKSAFRSTQSATPLNRDSEVLDRLTRHDRRSPRGVVLLEQDLIVAQRIEAGDGAAAGGGGA